MLRAEAHAPRAMRARQNRALKAQLKVHTEKGGKALLTPF
jgi:hypothetical protein